PLTRQLLVADGAVLEVLHRQGVQVMFAAARIEEVAGDHRVELQPPQLDPRAAEDQEIVFEVLPDLPDAFILQQFDQRTKLVGENSGEVQQRFLRGRTEEVWLGRVVAPGSGLRLPILSRLLHRSADMTEWQVVGAPRLDRQRDADPFGLHRVHAGGLRIQRAPADRADLPHQLLHLLRALYHTVTDFSRLRLRLRGGVFADQRVELQL